MSGASGGAVRPSAAQGPFRDGAATTTALHPPTARIVVDPAEIHFDGLSPTRTTTPSIHNPEHRYLRHRCPHLGELRSCSPRVGGSPSSGPIHCNSKPKSRWKGLPHLLEAFQVDAQLLEDAAQKCRSDLAAARGRGWSSICHRGGSSAHGCRFGALCENRA